MMLVKIITRFCKSVVKYLKWVFVLSLLYFFFAYYFAFNLSPLKDTSFIFGFLGILLGFALTIFTFIVSTSEKIKGRAERRFKDEKHKLENLTNKFDILFEEIKDDIKFIFISLVLIGIIYFLDGVVYLQKDWRFVVGLEAVRFSIFVLNMYAIYDLIMTSFKLSDSNKIIKAAENNGKQ